MFQILLLIQGVFTITPQELLTELNAKYDKNIHYLRNGTQENHMPYILTNKSPHFAIELQETYENSQSMNNNAYIFKRFPDSYILIANGSDIDWIQIQEFQVKQQQTHVNVLESKSYFGYFMNKGIDGGHILISEKKINRNFTFGKTDAQDKFNNLGMIYIISWDSEGDIDQIFYKFISLLGDQTKNSKEENFISFNSLDQVQCNFDNNFEHITFHTPDLYNPPIHYHIGLDLINQSLINSHFIKNYPGLQIFVVQNLGEQILDIKIPIKNMITNQITIDTPMNGLIITVQQQNTGFIHFIMFENENEIIINYKEDDNLAYISIAAPTQKIYILSFVTSSFILFPQVNILFEMAQEITRIIKLQNNKCEEPLETCQELNQDYFIKFPFNVSSTANVTFKINNNNFETPFIGLLSNIQEINLQFSISPKLPLINKEMNHGGFIGSLLKVTNQQQTLNSLIITQQNEDIEVYYLQQESLYNHSIKGIQGNIYALVFVTDGEISDFQSLQLFREFIDHIQKIQIFQQLELRCTFDKKIIDVKPIKFKEIHKINIQPNELIQKQNKNEVVSQNDENYSNDQNFDDGEYQYDIPPNQFQIQNDNTLSNNINALSMEDNQEYQNNQINNENVEEIRYSNRLNKQNQEQQVNEPKIVKINASNSKKNNLRQEQKSNNLSKEQLNPENSNEYKQFHQKQDYYGNEYGRGDYSRRDSYRNEYRENRNYQDSQYDRRDQYYYRDEEYNDRRHSQHYKQGPPLTGQSIIIPTNPSDQELGRFFREVIGKLQPCDDGQKINNYDRPYRELSEYKNEIYNRQDDNNELYRSSYKYNNNFQYKVCITVYSECYFQGESLQLCDHQTFVPKSQRYIFIKSIRSDENYVIEFYVRERNNQNQLVTLKGTQQCLKNPLRLDWLMQ